MANGGRIGDVNIRSRTVLAPACGVLNLPMRLAFKNLGAGLTVIGAIDAKTVAQSPEPKLINLLGREEQTCEAETPVAIQLIGSDPQQMAEAAARIEPLASIIDLNFSGPVAEAMHRGMGASLLSKPDRIADIVQAVVRRVGVPVTAKIRTGIRGRDIDAVEVAGKCESAGASAVTVHARSASDGYSGRARWEFISRIKQALGIPVIGNGAIRSAADAKAMMDRTGCDFVMICTAAFVNPMIFRETNAILAGRAAPKSNRLAGLLAFMGEYFRLVRKLEARSRRKAFKKAFRQFLALRRYMKKLQAGEVAFGETA